MQLATQLTSKYQSLVSEDNGEDDDGVEERLLAAAGCITAIRRILEALNKDKVQLGLVLPIIYPLLMHSLTPEGLDAIDEGLDCINIFVYYACDAENRVPNELWKLLPQMLFIVAGDETDVDGGFGFEFLGQVAVIVQNFVSKDPQGFLSVGEGQTQSFFELTVKFIQRILVNNAQGSHKQDGVTILRVVIAILENLPGQIDNALPVLVGILLAELKQSFENRTPSNYKSMVLQSIAMALYNNNVATLRVIENEQQTIAVFGNWL